MKVIKKIKKPMSAREFADKYNITLEVYRCSPRCKYKYRVHAPGVQVRTQGRDNFDKTSRCVIDDPDSELELLRYISETFSWKFVKLENGRVVKPTEIEYPEE